MKKKLILSKMRAFLDKAKDVALKSTAILLGFFVGMNALLIFNNYRLANQIQRLNTLVAEDRGEDDLFNKSNFQKLVTAELPIIKLQDGTPISVLPAIVSDLQRMGAEIRKLSSESFRFILDPKPKPKFEL